MRLIITLDENGAEIGRISIKTGEKVKDSWKIPASVAKDDFIYTMKKKKGHFTGACI